MFSSLLQNIQLESGMIRIRRDTYSHLHTHTDRHNTHVSKKTYTLIAHAGLACTYTGAHAHTQALSRCPQISRMTQARAPAQPWLHWGGGPDKRQDEGGVTWEQSPPGNYILATQKQRAESSLPTTPKQVGLFCRPLRTASFSPSALGEECCPPYP